MPDPEKPEPNRGRESGFSKDNAEYCGTNQYAQHGGIRFLETTALAAGRLMAVQPLASFAFFAAATTFACSFGGTTS